MTEVERCRHWSIDKKLEIVADCFAAGSAVLDIARRRNLATYRFRHLMPVMIKSDPEDKAAPADPVQADTIEIEIGDNCRVRVGLGFDGRALKRVSTS